MLVADARSLRDVLEPGSEPDSDLAVVGHLGGSRKVDVYLCRSKRFKGLVACKVLRPEHWIDLSALGAILEEGEILQRLRHPNVVEGYHVELEDHPRIVLQYLPGQTLKNTLFGGNYGAFDIGDVIDLAEQMAEALTYVHQQGLLHLDVKPSNFMYHDGHVTLFDFSVAEEFSMERPLRANAGTVEYMAPEQTYKGEVDYATDVFGLGVLFYQMLTGGTLPYRVVEHPVTGDEHKVQRRLDYTTPPKRPSDTNPAVPARVEAVATRAIRPSIGERYQTPLDFRAALRAAC